jgi:hypothetical protein
MAKAEVEVSLDRIANSLSAIAGSLHTMVALQVDKPVLHTPHPADATAISGAIQFWVEDENGKILFSLDKGMSIHSGHIK